MAHAERAAPPFAEVFQEMPPTEFPAMIDTGTMSAWAIFNMMGFYPDCPGEPAYTLSTPVFDKVTIKLDPKYWGRDQLVIETERPSQSRFISVKWNWEEKNCPDIVSLMKNWCREVNCSLVFDRYCESG